MEGWPEEAPGPPGLPGRGHGAGKRGSKGRPDILKPWPAFRVQERWPRVPASARATKGEDLGDSGGGGCFLLPSRLGTLQKRSFKSHCSHTPPLMLRSLIHEPQTFCLHRPLPVLAALGPSCLCGCGSCWNHPLPTSPGCWTHQGQREAWPGAASSLQRPGPFQGPAFPSEGSRDPCPWFAHRSTSLTSAVPTSLHSIPSGKCAWKYHMRNKGKVRGSESNHPHGQHGNQRARAGPDRS